MLRLRPYRGRGAGGMQVQALVDEDLVEPAAAPGAQGGLKLRELGARLLRDGARDAPDVVGWDPAVRPVPGGAGVQQLADAQPRRAGAV